ncbi:MAG: 50S ribosomal protein L11 methyltransferase [Balneolaceae bacterium]
MNYIQLHIQVPIDFQELLIAELFDLDFDGFEEFDEGFFATIPANRFDDTKRQEVELLVAGINGAELSGEKLIAPQNWNENWEKTIQPQTVGSFYVTPTWGTPPPEDSDLITVYIDPKMAFGTGYHATTRLVLEMLPSVVKAGDEVLDAGTGTGILGIAALKLGATSVFGFDIDEWCDDNCNENIQLNKVTNFEVRLGSTETIPSGAKYDVILANINRNALIELIPEFLKYLRKDGKLLLSGLLETDEQTILELPAIKNLTHLETRQQMEWIALVLEA